MLPSFLEERDQLAPFAILSLKDVAYKNHGNPLSFEKSHGKSGKRLRQ
jgi:hypothetical protein